MNTKNLSSALPLIPPFGNTMTLDQCITELDMLRDKHRAAIQAFWNGIKSHMIEPQPSWGRIQFDLHKLLRSTHNTILATDKEDFDAPTVDEARPFWDKVTAQIKDKEIASGMQMSDYLGLDLVAVISGDDGVTLVHRYEGDRIYNAAEDVLSVSQSTGADWYFESQYFEPEERSHEAPFIQPNLYLIGKIDPDTQEWMPKEVSSQELREIKQVTETMENLIDFNELGHPLWVTTLPTFPSGFNVRITELEGLSRWMSEKGARQDAEALTLRAAVLPMQLVLDDLKEKMAVLETKIDMQRVLQAKTEISAFLRFHGFCEGQSVTQSASGQSGSLCVSEGAHPVLYIRINGEQSAHLINDSGIRSSIRRGEWVAATEEDGEDGDQSRQFERQTS